ncbi:hypothetical protein AAFF_G00305290 [Aldrovandia affinis]|uniref:Uncharacterized protein n=1 Tax=Aldrovandia affinis TaxID=143900 RepID=A0AAD7SPM3_9TELE|nr:hypothetical protein AAFF_G00305290 [Aldrovandia affinis]
MAPALTGVAVAQGNAVGPVSLSVCVGLAHRSADGIGRGEAALAGPVTQSDTAPFLLCHRVGGAAALAGTVEEAFAAKPLPCKLKRRLAQRGAAEERFSSQINPAAGCRIPGKGAGATGNREEGLHGDRASRPLNRPLRSGGVATLTAAALSAPSPSGPSRSQR